MFFTFLENKVGKNFFFFLLETHRKTEQEHLIRSQWGFECLVAGNHTGSRGEAVLLKEIEYKIHSTIRDELGRYILTDIEFLNRCMTIGNIYEPSSGDL